MNLLEKLCENERQMPNKIALKTAAMSYTYEALVHEVNRVAAGLQQDGYKKGQHIAIISGNEPQFLIALYAIFQIGATAIPINPQYKKREMAFILEQSDTVAIIANAIHLKEIPERYDVITFGNEGRFDQYRAGEIEKIALNQEDVAVILYTSGTTGQPKGAMLTHANLYENTADVAAFLDITSEDRVIGVLPVFHVFALTVTVNAPLFVGATLLLEKGFSPNDIFALAIDQKATVFAGVPTMYNFLLQTPTEHDNPFETIRLAISGAASLPTAILEQFEQRFKQKISEGYGLSEASPVTCFNPQGKEKVGSVGTSIVNVDNRIFNEQGQEVASHEVGELVVKGANVMKGYYKLPQETAATIKDGWLYTGDLAYKDEEGYIFIVDRKKDLIIVGGFNVYPREVEEILYQHPAVKEAAVVGKTDDSYGERVVASVVLKDGEEVSEQQLIDFCRDSLVDYKVPAEVQFLTNLPKNTTGKIMKREL